MESIAPQQERVARALADVLASDSSPLVRSHALALMPRRTFGFEIEALIAALDDPSPEVSLTAGSHLARIGLSDPRAVPALCKAARKANELTREGAGINLETANAGHGQNDLPDDQLCPALHERRAGTGLGAPDQGRGRPPADRHRIDALYRKLREDVQKTRFWSRPRPPSQSCWHEWKTRRRTFLCGSIA